MTYSRLRSYYMLIILKFKLQQSVTNRFRSSASYSYALCDCMHKRIYHYNHLSIFHRNLHAQGLQGIRNESNVENKLLFTILYFICKICNY